jgi:hypothetical protein
MRLLSYVDEILLYQVAELRLQDLVLDQVDVVLKLLLDPHVLDVLAIMQFPVNQSLDEVEDLRALLQSETDTAHLGRVEELLDCLVDAALQTEELLVTIHFVVQGRRALDERTQRNPVKNVGS